MSSQKSVMAIVMALIFAAGGATAHSVDGGAKASNYDTSVWRVDLVEMREKIAANQPVEIPVGDLGLQRVLLTEFSVYSEGNKLRPVLDDAGKPVGYEPFPYWSYRGVLLDAPGASALITMDERGLYGHIKVLGEMTWFNPVNEDHVLVPGELAETHVEWTGGMVSLPDVAEAAAADAELQENKGSVYYQNPSGSWQQCSQEVAKIYAFADKRFTDAHSNYATRITNAITAQASMYDTQTCITTDLQPVIAPGYNYSTSTDCSTHLSSFSSLHNTYSGSDAYQLFTGINLNDCFGVGKVPLTAGNMAANKDSVVESVDHSGLDSYDPDKTTTHLGYVSGHEIGHNWGEPDHPNDTLNGDYNIMATGVPIGWHDFWFTNWGSGTSADRILSGTQGNL